MSLATVDSLVIDVTDERSAAVAAQTAQARWGSVDDAGRLCRTDSAPDGVSGRTYRSYVNRLGAPGVGRYDEATGEPRYDLDAVEAWHASRPGQGRRGITRQTAYRREVLDAAEAGSLELSDARPPLRLAGKALGRGHKRAVAELQEGGYLAESHGRLRPTPRGRELLAQWCASPETASD